MSENTSIENNTISWTPEPVFVQAGPYQVDLVPNKDYYWCACGKSKSQPFCDGSHKGSGITPIKFTVDEAKKYFLCGCKVSDSKPFCDGTHRKEKGLRKYNEFLLKKNGELVAMLEASKASQQSHQRMFITIAALAVVATVALFRARQV
ncbi:hypothetical protein HK101_000458 [Irineochytrium annulatum]|nr:hypothetical protein HK101_000458 [Irineochytrium annulatum]